MRIALAVLSLLLVGAPGHVDAGSETQPISAGQIHPARDSRIMVELGYLVTAADVIAPSKNNVRDDLNKARGGNDSDKPLGCYFCNPPLVFKSIYPSEPSGTIVAWTYDLHRFLLQEEGVPVDMRSAKQDWDKSPGYKVVRDKFALAWWKAHSAAFADLLPLSQRGFVYDAIIDGANIWSRYELLSDIGPGDELLYNEDIMDSYRNASASEIFF